MWWLGDWIRLIHPNALVSILIEVKPACQTANLPRIFSALRRLSGCIARRLASMGKRWDTGDHGSINGYTHGDMARSCTISCATALSVLETFRQQGGVLKSG